ncbi:MAG TPA: indolepyruvate ferredoxin oxidoreductase family protein [Candidatus Paceibacterota bacterium]|nr:indolepyruvate ferredoxin oxidoreductase family protein [Candidatus Paceibacterota bacterium]
MNDALADLKFGFDGPSADTPKWCTGLQALIVLLALRKRCDAAKGLATRGYVSGYRGSPLAGLDKELERARDILRAHEIVFEPGMNEAFAAGAVLGTQGLRYFDATCDGVFGLWYGKHPGLLQALDAIDHANFAGMHEHGGVLLVSGDDHGCKSSTKQSQSDLDFVARAIPYIAPSSVDDIVRLGLHAYEISRIAGVAVGLKMVADLADSTGLVDLASIRAHDPSFPPREYLGAEYPDGPPLSHDSVYDPKRQHQIYLERKLELVREYVRWNHLDRVIHACPGAHLGIVSSGTTSGEVLQALEMLGPWAEARVALFRVAVPWPLEKSAVLRFVSSHFETLVIEELRGVIEPQLKAYCFDEVSARPRSVIGKWEPHRLLSDADELDAAKIALAIAARLEVLYLSDQTAAAELQLARTRIARFVDDASRKLLLPARKSMYCAGCPHNTSTRVPEGSKAIAGIGCHFMAKWIMPGTNLYTAMGVEGSPWLGVRHFVKDRHAFVNLGDGTFFHSGSLAIRAAVAQHARVTFKVLYNDAVAMTGGQKVDGELSVEKVVAIILAEGVRRIAVVSEKPEHYDASFTDVSPDTLTIHHRDDLASVEQELASFFGVSVIVYEQTCAAEKRRRRKHGTEPDPDRRLFINPAVCEGCGDCGIASNCVAIHPLETPEGTKRTIDQSTCNKDYSCVKGFCPSFVSLSGARRRVLPVPNVQVPDPLLPLLTGRFSVIIPGVGGTGVVTVAQILGTAGVLAGYASAVLDKTGMAQKNGKVDSDVTFDLPARKIAHAKIPPGGADLMIACDLVSATAEDIRSRMRENALLAANMHATPTADFVTNPAARIEPEKHLAALCDRFHPARIVRLDALDLAERYFASAQYANMIMLGAAWQSAMLPIARDPIQTAITLNGVHVEANTLAFMLGRIAVASPEALLEPRRAEPPRELPDLIDHFTKMLTDYQDASYARKYRATIARTLGREREVKDVSAPFALTRAVAMTYPRLLAYKDEYEVARLFTGGQFLERLAAEFEHIDRITFHMAPPLFARKDPETGHLRKSTYGPWMLFAMRLLARLKGLRGTRFDPFGYSHDRKLEREIIAHYEEKLAVVLRGLTAENLPAAIALVSIDADVRGFGHVKEASLAHMREREERLWKAFRDPSRSSHEPGSRFKGIRIVSASS